MAEVTLVAPVLAAALLGGLLGCLTGMVPGLHSNNAAALLGASPALVLAAASAGALRQGDPGWALVTCAAIASCAVAHTVANIVPSVFVAVPDPDSALAVLPGHRMAREGRGLEALEVSVASSVASLAIALALVPPLAWLLAGPWHGYAHVDAWMGPVVLLVSVLLVLRESRKAPGRGRLKAPLLVLTAGLVWASAGLLGSMTLFSGTHVGALFLGLFGLPTLLVAARGGAGVAPAGGGRRGRGRLPAGPVLRGALAGGLAGWVPGISPAQATILSSTRRDHGDDSTGGARRFIAGVSAVNTASAVLNVVALATLLRVRSGAMASVDALMAWPAPPWDGSGLPPTEVAVLLSAMAVGGLVAAPVTLALGRGVARLSRGLSDGRFLRALALALLAACAALGGWTALTVALAATALGMVPPTVGVMRVHLMGAVTVPLVMGSLLA